MNYIRVAATYDAVNGIIKEEEEAGADLESIEVVLCGQDTEPDIILWFSKEDVIPLDEINWDSVTLVEILKLFLDNNGNPFSLLKGELDREKIIEWLQTHSQPMAGET